MKESANRLLVGVILLASLAPLGGCSKSANRMSVLDTTPDANATDIATDATVKVKFSSSVRENTLSTATFHVVGSLSGAIEGTITYDDETRIATFKPSTAFKEGETVTVDLTKSIIAKSGASLRGIRFQFTVKLPDEPDTPSVTPPDASVTSRAPAPWSTTAAADATIRVQLSERMNSLTFTSDSVRVNGSLAGAIGVQISEIAVSGNVLVLIPARQFLPGERITVTLTSGLATAAGGKFAGDVFEFQAACGAPEGSLCSGPTYLPGWTVAALRLADLDLDGILDLITISTAGTTVKVARGKGMGSFETALELSVDASALCIETGDIDADGRMDILAGALDRAVLFRGSGTGIAFADPQVLATGTAVRGIALGNIDRLRGPDVLLDTDRGIRLYLNGLSGDPALVIGEARVPRTDILTGDLNLDGIPDVLYGDSEGDRLALHRGGPPAWLLPAEGTSLGGDALWVAAADLDGDGNPQVIVHAASDSGSGLGVLSMPASATPSLEPLSDAALRTFCLADMNGDGLPDLVSADPEGAKVLVFDNGAGAFDLEAPREIATGYPAERVCAGDLTGDGALDLVVAAGQEVRTILGEKEEDPDPEASMEVDSIDATAGDAARSVSIRLTSTVAVEGYTVVLAFDRDILQATAMDLTGTTALDLVPEFVVPFVDQDEGYASIAVTFDLLPPFEGKTLAAGSGIAIANFRFGVSENAPEGDTMIELKDGLGDPQLSNLVVQGGKGISPTLGTGTVSVHAGPDPDPEVAMGVDSIDATAGDVGKSVSVRLTSNVTVEGYTAVVAFDRNILQASAIDLTGTTVLALLPEFMVPVVNQDEGYAAITVTFDLLPPFESKTLAAGSDIAIANFRFGVSEDAPEGDTLIEIEDGLGVPPLSNLVVHEGEGIAPSLGRGTVSVHASQPTNPNRLRIEPTTAEIGKTGQKANLRITCVQAVDAYTIIIGYDPAATAVTGADVEGTLTGDGSPEFTIPYFDETENVFEYSVIFDFMPPYDRQQILPVEDGILFRIVFDVPADAALGEHVLQLRNEVGNPPLSNNFVVEGLSVFPDLTDGTVTISDGPAEATFIRGDANGSGKMDIADGIYILNFLYKEGPVPPCMDAADVDDNGRVNMTDGVNAIDYVFKGSPVPMAPFPAAGLDPTADDMTCLDS
jgi:hypothetical protein